MAAKRWPRMPVLFWGKLADNIEVLGSDTTKLLRTYKAPWNTVNVDWQQSTVF